MKKIKGFKANFYKPNEIKIQSSIKKTDNKVIFIELKHTKNKDDFFKEYIKQVLDQYKGLKNTKAVRSQIKKELKKTFMNSEIIWKLYFGKKNE